MRRMLRTPWPMQSCQRGDVGVDFSVSLMLFVNRWYTMRTTGYITIYQVLLVGRVWTLVHYNSQPTEARKGHERNHPMYNQNKIAFVLNHSRLLLYNEMAVVGTAMVREVHYGRYFFISRTIIIV